MSVAMRSLHLPWKYSHQLSCACIWGRGPEPSIPPVRSLRLRLAAAVPPSPCCGDFGFSDLGVKFTQKMFSRPFQITSTIWLLSISGPTACHADHVPVE